MPLEAIKDNLSINRILGKKNETIFIEGDVIIPDIKPDILSTIKSNGNICIYKKEVMNGKIKIDGYIQTYVMYFADGTEDNIRGLTTNIEFSKIIDFEDAKENSELELKMFLNSIECKILNERKISIKAEVETQIVIYSNEQIQYINDVKQVNGIQMQRKEININTIFSRGRNRTFAKDTIIIDNVDNLAEILQVNTNIINKDTKISYNKVLAKADMDVKILYLTEDGRINNINNKIPIMGFIDIPDITDDKMCYINYNMTNLVVNPNSIEEHSIYIEAEIELSCNVYENKIRNLIEDLYSTDENLDLISSNMDILEKKTNIVETYNMHEKKNISEILGAKIIDTTVTTTVKQTVLNSKVAYEGDIILSLLYQEESKRVNSKTIKIPYQYSISNENISQNCDIETDTEIVSQDFVIMPDGNIDIKIDINFVITITTKNNISIVKEVNVNESYNEPIYSIVIYYVKPGDTLWKIAKKFRSTVDEIAKMNSIEDVDYLQVGRRLFIPRSVGTRNIALA